MAPRTPLLDPWGYFERTDRPTLERGLGFVFLTAVLVTIAVWIFVREVLGKLTATAAQREAAMGEMGVYYVAAFFGVVIGWLILSAVIHLYPWLFGSARGIGATLAIVGEAEIVNVVLFPLTIGGMMLVVGQIPADPAAAQEFISKPPRQLSPLLVVVGLVGTAWRAYIYAAGLAEVQGLTSTRAYVIAFGVSIVSFLIGFV